jgi:hypothetical protein
LLRILFAGVLVMIGTASPAQKTSPPSADSDPIVVTGKTAKENKRVCKSSVATGSILPQKICKKQSEWDEQRERDLLAMERIVADQETRQQVQELRNVQ